MKKIDLFTFSNDLMGVGFSANDAQRIVTLLDVRQREAGEKDRERSRRWAEANPRRSDQRDNSAYLLTSSISSSEQKGKPKVVVKKKVRKIPLPEDFAPTDAHFAKATELGCSPAFVLSKFEDLKTWALSNDARKADWSQTLHGFIRRDAAKGRQHEQPNYGQTVRTAVTQLKSGNIAAINPAGSGPSARPALRLVSAGESDQS